MNKIIITTDSTCDLSKELIEKYHVEIVPLHVVFPTNDYLDGKDISVTEVYKKVEEIGTLPKTSAVTPHEFEVFFKKFIDDGDDILYFGIGAKMSSTMQNAYIASKEFPEGRIRVLDSGNLSTGIGLLVLKACKYRDQGMTLNEIGDKIEYLVPRVKSQFVIETLEYLYKGGRCNSLTHILGNALKIRPMIVVRNGTMTSGKNVIGSMKKALRYMMDMFLQDIKNADDEFVFVTDSIAPESQNIIREWFKDNHIEDKFKNVNYTNAGCVVGSHCGAGTIGILYIMKDPVTK